MPNVFPIPKLLRKVKAKLLWFLFTVKVQICLLHVKVEILQDEW